MVKQEKIKKAGAKEKVSLVEKMEGGITNLSIDDISPGADIKPSKVIRWSKVDSIEIENFKAIDNIDLKLGDVTLLVGPNGSGKSSILQAIHWATRAASYIPPKNQSEVVAFDRLDYSPSSEPLKSAYKKELSSDTKSLPSKVTFRHIPTEDSTPTVNIRIWAARNRGGISVHIDGGLAVSPFKQRSEFITAYIPGLAGMSEKETILVQPLLRRQAASGDAGGVLRNVLFNIASRQPGENDNSQALQRLDDLNKLIQIIHPSVTLEVRFDDREDINIRAVFDDPVLLGIKRPLETAATGILQVIQIFAYLIFFKPKLLLIDEPDAHLHPDKQERLIEALEKAAGDYQVQVMLTTHSPHVVRAASPNANLIWIREGKAVDAEDSTIRALLGWGGLDKKILFFIEDEDDQPIRAILKQWPDLYRQMAICRCFGVDNLPRNSLLEGFIGDNQFGVKALIHRDRDFMTDDECQKWADLYPEKSTLTWVTKNVDAEAYFCQPDYLAALYQVDISEANTWVSEAVKKCSGARDLFFKKRKVINNLLYKDGGSPSSDTLWSQMGEVCSQTTLGKTLHKQLKVVVKAAKKDDTLLNKFSSAKGFTIAPELAIILREMLK